MYKLNEEPPIFSYSAQSVKTKLIEFIFYNNALVRLHGDCMTKGISLVITKTY